MTRAITSTDSLTGSLLEQTTSRRPARWRGALRAGAGAALAGLLVLAARAERFDAASFDLGAARNAGDLAAVVLPRERVAHGITVREVQFTSRVWDRWGRWRPMRIQAFLAVPPGSYPRRSKPIVITAHGLGARGTPEAAAELCRNLDVVALALSAPGVGASEGDGVTADDARPLFATVPDVRGSWLYAYTYALLRAITFAQQQPEADPRAVVLTGNSIGGIATLVANGVDDRIRGVLAVSTSGALGEATAQGSWLRRLVLSTGGLEAEGPEARALFRGLDPLAFAGRQRGVVFLLIGAQDEFFPLGQALATYRALRAPAKSLTLVADYDHGWYFGQGCPAACMPGGARRPAECPGATVCPRRCPAGAQTPYCGPEGSYNHHDAFIGRWSVLLRALVAQHAAHPRRPFAAPPPAPVVERRDDEVVVRVMGPMPLAVRLAVSEDGGFTYRQRVLAREADGSYRLRRRVSGSAILFAEVELPDGVVASSSPSLPWGFRPRVRPFRPLP
ncbi:MAG: hypothetical protein IT371_14070 [Deltaproteobacteria bacterium]|nr:hypothetical protein [Deltaproteobacteria bacterium]